ncbi:hypothetical protein RJT34_07694 [Clitoria ternatea]|uniref:KIB1-4 beta-propeller domain-containing protein n=1 Tax=Clitoria ternatea TaxID=43366 RepID=A0AAN9K647_CLITE
MQKTQTDKIVLSCAPHHHDKEKFMAVGIYGEFRHLAFCRFGDDKWSDIPTSRLTGFGDVTFHEDKIYALDFRGYLHEFNTKRVPFQRTTITPPPHGIPFLDDTTAYNRYTVWNPEGDLLFVIRHFQFGNGNGDKKGECYRTSRFLIYKFNKNAKEWSQESSLGDYVLLLGFNSSTWMPPFSDEQGNWVLNCIYYTDDNLISRCTEQVIGGHDVGIFNLQDENITPIFPNSYFLHPPPIWVWRQ